MPNTTPDEPDEPYEVDDVVGFVPVPDPTDYEPLDLQEELDLLAWLNHHTLPSS